MKKDKIGFGFALKPDLVEAKAFVDKEFIYPEFKGSVLWYTDVDGNTKLWKGEIEVPFNVTYKLNEELDYCSIKIKSAISLGADCIRRKIPNMAKVKLLYEANKDDFHLDYDKFGRPTNHDDFYVVGGSCSFIGSPELYKHEYQFVEPTYVLRYVICENRSFTNMTEISITDAASGVVTKYTQDPTNLLYILEHLLKTTGVKTSVEDTTWHSKIKIMDKELLRNNGVGSNINFNQASLYDNLFKIGKYLKRYPVLYFNKDYDPSGYFWETNEDRREFLLFFERYDGLDKPTITEEEFFKDSLGWTHTHGAGKDAGTVVCDAQNVVGSTSVWYPAKGYYVPICDSSEDVVVYKQDDVIPPANAKETISKTACIKLPNNIDRIVQVRGFLYSYDKSGIQYTKEENILNSFIYPVLEYNEYKVKTQDQEDYLYYKKGTNLIQGFSIKTIAKYGNAKDTFDHRSYGFSVEYVPSSAARIIKGQRNQLESNLTQNDSTLDSDLFGSFIENYAKENAGLELTNAKIFDNYSDIYGIATNIIGSNNDKSIISSINIARHKSGYSVGFIANENIIKRSEVVTNESTADNKVIQSEKATLRLSNISEKDIRVYFNTDIPIFTQEKTKYLDVGAPNINFFGNFLLDETNIVVPEMAYINFFVRKSTYVSEMLYRCLPIIKSSCGNSILFSIVASSNLWLTTAGGVYKDVKGDDSYYNNYNKYVGPFGKIEQILIKFGSLKSDFFFGDTKNVSYSGSKQATDFGYDIKGQFDNIENTSVKYRNFGKNFPTITEKEYLDAGYFARIDNYMYFKEATEIANISFQMNFIPFDNNTILNTNFVKNLAILKVDNIKKKYYLLDIPSDYALGENETIAKKDCVYWAATISLVESDSIFESWLKIEAINTRKQPYDQIALAFLEEGSELFKVIIISKSDASDKLDTVYLYLSM